MKSRHAYAKVLFVALLTSKASSFAPDGIVHVCLKGFRTNNSHRHPRLEFSSVQRDSLPVAVEEGGRKSELSRHQRNEIDALVEQRADARRCGDYNLADQLRIEIEACTERVVAPGYQIELRDIPRKDGGGSTWDIVPKLRDSIERFERGESVLQLSHIALGHAILSAEQDVALDSQVLEGVVSEALARLETTGATELRGRKSADAAFWFALSGASSPDAVKLFHRLTVIAIEELERFGNKSSCRAKDVMHIVERLYATGITGDLSKQLSHAAANCLIGKEFAGRNTSTNSSIIDLLQSYEFDIHCDRPLLWLWRFSIRQKKQRSFLRGATKTYERYRSRNSNGQRVSGKEKSTEYTWSEFFHDPNKPLVIDIGCGYGVSLHGLATLKETDLMAPCTDELGIDWSQCNFLGMDLSRTAIGFASSLSTRWEMNGRLAYVVGSAEDVLQAVLETYPGNICLAMIQFPTPFKLQKASDEEGENDNEAKGNAQLPKHPYANFMVTSNLLHITRETLLASSRGKLVIQSNVEDVAVFMRQLAEKSGFSIVPVSNPIASFDEVKARIPQRTKEYIKTGRKRALGDGWARDALLPRRGATETEVACFLETTPIHRCVLTPSEQVNNKLPAE